MSEEDRIETIQIILIQVLDLINFLQFIYVFVKVLFVVIYIPSERTDL